MIKLHAIIEQAQAYYSQRLERLEKAGGLTQDQYVRYLSMQYYLTRGVQRHFFLVASHSDLCHKRSLRKFLVKFGMEEELHYEIARSDLSKMGKTPLVEPLEVSLWWAYFDRLVVERPFVRLGATCILENIANGRSSAVIDRLVARADYLSKDNSEFLVIHRHQGPSAHGSQIIEALNEAELSPTQYSDVLEGAETATVLYLRMVEWALDTPTGNHKVCYTLFPKTA